MFYYVFNTTGTLVTQNFSFDTAPPVISFFAFATFLFALVWYILISIKYQFYSFVLIDKNLKIKDVFKKSASISNGVRIQLFSMLVLLVLINILVSFTTFGFGFILSLPFSILVLASVYQKLSLTMDSNEALKRVDPATMATLPRVE